MQNSYSKLLLYSNIGPDSILGNLADIFGAWSSGSREKTLLRRQLLLQVKGLLDLATENGFDENLWHNYLTYLLMTTENSFSLSCERVGCQDGSVNHFAKLDFQAFWELYHYDFSEIEADLGLDCFTVLQHYQAIPKKERRYNRAVSEAVRDLSRKLGAAKNGEEIFQLITQHYKEVGVGSFGLNQAFRLEETPENLAFLPVHNVDAVALDNLVGYELQKQQLRYNTEAFVSGRRANNVLLYGDSGTGKSTSVKALLREYGARGLRMIELYKHQFQSLPALIAALKHRNYSFIIFIDDLSFEDDEVEYKFLKAVIEGGVETKPDNILIYATSNRRHLIRETWKDRDDTEFTGEIHRSDTVEEKLSLSSRFGVLINYSTPNRDGFKGIVLELARRQGIEMPEDELLRRANQWEIRHGGISGRTAQQFVNYLAGESK